MDVFETEESVAVRIEIPGVRGEDIRVNVDGEILRISGIRRVPESARVKRLHQMEIAFGSFEREVRIALPFDRGGVNAHLEDGFLLVTLPKEPPPARKEIVVDTE